MEHTGTALVEHQFFLTLFLFLFDFYLIFLFFIFTDARRASDKNRVRKIGVMSRDFAPPASSPFSVPVPVPVSVSVPVSVVVFLLC